MFYLDGEEHENPQEEADQGLDMGTPEESGGGDEESSQDEQSQTGSLRESATQRLKSAKGNISKNKKILSHLKGTKAMSWVAKFILPILPYVLIAVIIFIIVVGLIMFLLMLPGILMGQLNELSEKVAGYFVSIWQSDAQTAVTDRAVIEVADYLESMGYDLREYGFVTSAVTEAVSGQISLSESEKKNAFIDTNGIGRTSNGITNINSEVIRTYLLSDNYVYCCRNFDKNITTAFSSIGKFLIGLFKNDTAWGKGLITIYEEDSHFWNKGKIGIQGEDYSNSWLSKNYISVDAEDKTLTIKTKTGVFGLGRGRSFTYKLDGWTARYGMPLEFLLAVHITSMSPDLAVDLATSFDTEVVILLHETTSNVIAGFKTDDGEIITHTEFQSLVQNSFWEGVSGAEVVSNEDAMKVLKNTSLVNSDCESDCKNSDEEEACDSCEKYIERIRDDLKAISSKKIETFVPYISKVTDHWFRDVYFVAPLEMEVITNDEDYEAETGERWTKYETTTDADGNVSYVLYILKEDGTIGDEKYNGTSEDAKKEGISVTKKAVTTQIQDIAEEETIQSRVFGKDYWTAYKIGTTTSGWELYTGVEEGTISLNFPDNIYYQVETLSNISQIQDAQRGVTNANIKKIFSTNKYYMYDGTVDRAERIEADKKITNRSYDNTPKDERDPDLIGTFSVTRDSLTAFNILENMNTFDADSIYRDFKELIVELDYFDKEDLTETSSVVWEWPLVDSGTGGWPIRRYEKIEDEYGTLINSKVDLDNLKEVDRASLDLTGDGIADGEYDEETEEIEDTKDTEETEEITVVTQNDSNLSEITDSIGSSSFISNKNTTNITDMLKTGSYKGSTFLETAKNCWEYIVNSGRYSYAGASIPVDQGSTVDCSSFVSWVLYEYGYEDFKGAQHGTIAFMNTDWEAAYGWQEITVAAGEDCRSLLQPGDIFVRDGGDNVHHVQIIVEVEADGNVITYDCGAATHWVSSYIDGFSFTPFSRGDSAYYAPGKIIRIENQTAYNDPFEGYGPYEDVVSPISGEIIEAGITTITNIETNVEEDVGYIKIKALDESDYKTYFDSNDEELEGYKYFYEDYEKANVTGDILYIEGFDLRIVDENLNLIKDEAILDEDTGDIRNRYTKDTYDDVLSDDAREVLEEKEDKRDEAKSVVKTSDGKIFVKEGTVLGKTYTDGDANEDEDIPDDAKERPGISKIPEDQKTMTDDDGNEIDMPNGNYIRLILRTAEDGSDATSNKDAIIENVEDYLEIDDTKKEEIEWELFYWLPFESGGLDISGCGPESFSSCSSGETAVGIIQWTALGSMNNISGFISSALEKNASLCSPLSRIQNYSVSDYYNAYTSGGGVVKSVLSEICANDRDEFINIQMEIAKEQYLDPLLKEYPWLESRSLIVQGEIMHLRIWGASISGLNSLQNASDEDILSWVGKKIANTSTTAGEASGDTSTGRAWSEPKIGIEYLKGNISAEELETWIRQKDASVFPDGVYKGG